MPYNPCCCTPAGCGVCSDGEPSTGTLTISGLAFTGVSGCPCTGINAVNGDWALPRAGCGPVSNSIWLANCAAPNGSSGQLLFPLGGNVQYYGAGFSSGFPEYVLTTLNVCLTPFGTFWTHTVYGHVFVGRSAMDSTKFAVKAFLRILGNEGTNYSLAACGIASSGACAGQAVSLTPSPWFGATSCSPLPTMTWTFA